MRPRQTIGFVTDWRGERWQATGDGFAKNPRTGQVADLNAPGPSGRFFPEVGDLAQEHVFANGPSAVHSPLVFEQDELGRIASEGMVESPRSVPPSTSLANPKAELLFSGEATRQDLIELAMGEDEYAEVAAELLMAHDQGAADEAIDLARLADDVSEDDIVQALLDDEVTAQIVLALQENGIEL